jgi:hypothetical protein
MGKEPRNIGASVRARLLNLAQKSRSFSFDDDRLSRAIAATFERRGTPIPADAPDGLTSAFASDEQKQAQWEAFVAEVTCNPG